VCWIDSQRRLTHCGGGQERIWEVDAMVPRVWGPATTHTPLLRAAAADERLAAVLNERAPALQLSEGTRPALKVQFNEGAGGCFPMHFDSDLALDSRQVRPRRTRMREGREGWEAGSSGGQQTDAHTSTPGPPLARGSVWAGGRVHTPSRRRHQLP
jgi:hypothetical protein